MADINPPAADLPQHVEAGRLLVLRGHPDIDRFRCGFGLDVLAARLNGL